MHKEVSVHCHVHISSNSLESHSFTNWQFHIPSQIERCHFKRHETPKLCQGSKFATSQMNEQALFVQVRAKMIELW